MNMNEQDAIAAIEAYEVALQDLHERMRADSPEMWELIRDQALFNLRVFLKSMTKAERLQTRDFLLAGYCPVCARWLYGGEECYCWNDE